MATKTEKTQITRTLLSLREQILSGEFAPGERMSELPLVDRLGVSRTPLRLALAALEHEGLLEQLPGGGYAVREFTRGEIADAIEIRGVLEGTAARFAAERGATVRELRTLKGINDRIGALVQRLDYDSFVAYMELNEQFHGRLLKLACSVILERAMAAITSLPFAGASAFVLAEAELTESRDILPFAHHQHAVLVEAIAERQGSRAESVAREHAWIALANLRVATAHPEVFQQIPGASLVSLSGTVHEAEPFDAPLMTVTATRRPGPNRGSA
jgi:GntR family transcriptional regulator of vanillate catabolism